MYIYIIYTYISVYNDIEKPLCFHAVHEFFVVVSFMGNFVARHVVMEAPRKKAVGREGAAWSI